MRDGPIRRSVKALVRGWFALETRRARWVLKLRGEPRYRLEGTCEGCGRCCEKPSIRVGFATFHFPLMRWLFLSWQRRVNGFDFLESERSRVLVFRCTHFDPATKLCDSYGSRPAMCRDYPRMLLYQPWPELFEECTHRVVSIGDQKLREALDEAALGAEKRAGLERRLRLRQAIGPSAAILRRHEHHPHLLRLRWLPRTGVPAGADDRRGRVHRPPHRSRPVDGAQAEPPLRRAPRARA
ncbi:MAG: YkgJ family cysteine cluster protein [Proteobacteria bacterium]|nr:YkgJ family cysteine cluster protein [Pseudomonadota bacterium]